ncbi:MAG: efflux RND transporter periplasmic adaptor subunit [Chlorobiota bacterium]
MKLIITILISIFMIACGNDAGHNHEEEHGHDEHNAHESESGHDDHGEHEDHDEHGEEGVVEINTDVYKTMGIVLDSLATRNMSEAVYATGHLKVPPNNEATVTAMVGANIKSIRVIEGDKVRKGQTLLTMEHPNLIEMQTEYVELSSQLEYLKNEYEREEKLYNSDASSGKSFQKAKSEYLTTKARYYGQLKKLRMLNIDTDKVLDGEFSDVISIRSPIGGFVNKILAKTGQYINPNDEIIHIVDNHHVHVHFMVFEKDAIKIKKGQQVRFTTDYVEGKEFEAEVYSVGKSFEEDPKAVHIHAEMSDNKYDLIPGLYVKGQILIDEHNVKALPESAIVSDKGKDYIFVYSGSDEEHTKFELVEIKTGLRKDDWVEVKAILSDEDIDKIVYNKAYTLQSEKDKGAGGHHHH